MSSDLEALQRRLAKLEREVRDLRTAVAGGNREKSPPWWRKIAGRFENDPAFDEILRLGRKIRKQPRKRRR